MELAADAGTPLADCSRQVILRLETFTQSATHTRAQKGNFGKLGPVGPSVCVLQFATVTLANTPNDSILDWLSTLTLFLLLN